MSNWSYDQLSLFEEKSPARFVAETADAMMALKAEDDEMYGCSIPESFDGERAVETLRKLPSAQDRKTGRWKDYPIADGCIQCSACGVLRMGEPSNYCPNCGAKMEVEHER